MKIVKTCCSESYLTVKNVNENLFTRVTYFNFISLFHDKKLSKIKNKNCF